MNRRTFALSVAAIAATVLSGPALAGDRTGTFKGENGHVTTGGVTVKNGQIVLEKDFSLDGAPDPRVGLGKGGRFAEGTDFVPLGAKTGKQTYAVPAGIDVNDYDTVFIWCRQFSVSLGQASVR